MRERQTLQCDEKRGKRCIVDNQQPGNNHGARERWIMWEIMRSILLQLDGGVPVELISVEHKEPRSAWRHEGLRHLAGHIVMMTIHMLLV